jgi:L-histidine N-alpha-methyltransferase
MNTTLAADRIEVRNFLLDTFYEEIRKDVFEGLTSCRKSIPSKYFYDARGSRLFREICRLPEYYQTRTELSILKKYSDVIIEKFRDGYIVELGSGENLKIRTLLDAAFESSTANICYVPVDVSEPTLIESSMELIAEYPDLRVSGIVADFTRHMKHIPCDRKKLFLFFGSTIGNFSDEERKEFLKNVAQHMGPDDRFLLGIDMIKPAGILERAYNDSRGVTDEFNKNILDVLNRELNADFDKSYFDHLAFYNSGREQIEMHLRASSGLSVEIGDLDLFVRMKKDETIQTEICKKFSRRSTEQMAEEAGLKIRRWFTERDNWFSLAEFYK